MGVFMAKSSDGANTVQTRADWTRYQPWRHASEDDDGGPTRSRQAAWFRSWLILWPAPLWIVDVETGTRKRLRQCRRVQEVTEGWVSTSVATREGRGRGSRDNDRARQASRHWQEGLIRTVSATGSPGITPSVRFDMSSVCDSRVLPCNFLQSVEIFAVFLCRALHMASSWSNRGFPSSSRLSPLSPRLLHKFGPAVCTP